MSIITRTAKGSKLTIQEMDGNLEYLQDEVNNKISKSVGPTYTTNVIITLTQAEYNELEETDPTTLYFIVE